MAQGNLRVEVPVGSEDAVGLLGRGLVHLGVAMEARLTRARKLADVIEQLNRGLTLADVLDHIFDGFRGIIPFDRIGCALIEADGLTARSVWARSEASHLELGVDYTAPLAGSSLQTIIDTGEPRILNDLEAYLVEHPESASTAKIVAEGIRSSLTCPLLANDRPVGFLFFSSCNRATYRDSHVDLFRQIAGPVALGVERSRLHQEVLDTQRQLEAANVRLEQLARRDPLTGVANRRTFDEQLGREWRRAARSDAPLSLLMIDIDAFKRYNDTFGHQQGDQALRQVAEVLQGVARRAGDWVARYGGEEFAVLLAGTDVTAAAVVAERLRRGVEALAINSPNSPVAPQVTVSIGVASSTVRPGTEVEQLVALADAALYDAKRAGRNCVRISP